jgi:hypothetical protein
MLEQDTSYRPRVPHETRRLLIAGIAALLSLWALARVRFPDQTTTANPVGPLLGQLAPRVRFDDLAAQIATVRSRIDAFVYSVEGPGLTAVRAGTGVALSIVDANLAVPADAFARFDRASGLGVIETNPNTSRAVAAAWSPTGLEQPRYLIAASAGSSGLHVTPIFLSALVPVTSPVWPGSVWALDGSADLPVGTLVFTEDGQFVGAVWAAGQARAIVPAATLLAEADRLLSAPPRVPGWLGLNVAPLTPALTRATGAATGVIVTSLDPRSPATSILRLGDVIERVDDQPTSPLHWHTRERRVGPEERLALRIRRAGSLRDVTITAVAPPPRTQRTALGLTLRRVARGSEVQGVANESVAHAAGLRPGDIIVQAGAAAEPTPTQVRRTFAEIPVGEALLVAIDRTGIQHVIALEKDAPEQP